VRDELETLLRKHKAEEQFYELSQKFQNLVYEHPESLTPAAEALGLRIMQSDWFSSSGGNGIVGQPKVVEAAFSPEVLAQGRNSGSIEVGANAFVAVRALARREATTRPLAQVRPEIEQIVKAQLAQEEAEKFGVKMLEQLKQGENFAALARSQGLQVVVPKPIGRREHPGVDNRIVEAVFKAPRPASDKPHYDGLPLGKEGYAIFALKRVEQGNAKPADAVKNQAKQALENRRGQEYYTAYLAGLRKQANVRVYADRL
jgi:peptidyl-prolyl cis-trans isomerase D